MAKTSNNTTLYRTCFSTGAGMRTLGDILSEAGFFDTDLKTPEEIAVQNFAKKILRKMGLCGEDPEFSWLSPDNIDSFVQKLFELSNK